MAISELVIMFIVTSTIGCVLTISRLLYKSKCVSIEFCGCKIIRDTAVEEHEDMRRIENMNRSEDESIST